MLEEGKTFTKLLKSWQHKTELQNVQILLETKSNN